MTQILTAQIPFSQEAEEAVIGAVLVNPNAFMQVAAFLQTEHFYILRNQLVWTALKRIADRDGTIDYVTVQDELRAMKRLDDIGGPVYLTQLINSTPTSMHADVYGRIVLITAERRKLLEAADKIKGFALDEANPNCKLDSQHALDTVLQASQRTRYLSGADSIAYYDSVQAEIRAKLERGEPIGYPLPEAWDALRARLPLILDGEFMVISGPPGSGKSALLEMLVEWFATFGQVLYIHTEMNTKQILHRRMARHSQTAFHQLNAGAIDAFAMDAADLKIGQFARNIGYHWMPDPRFEALAMELRRAAAAGVKFFVIDHFQDIQPHIGREGFQRSLEDMVTWLAGFAEFREIVMVIASQQNAQGKVKWTQKLHEKALTLLSIKRPLLKTEVNYRVHNVDVRAHEGEVSPYADLTIQKARFGSTGKVKMLYHGPAFEWVDLSRIQRAVPAGKIVRMEDLQAMEAANE